MAPERSRNKTATRQLYVQIPTVELYAVLLGVPLDEALSQATLDDHFGAETARLALAQGKVAGWLHGDPEQGYWIRPDRRSTPPPPETPKEGR